MLEWCKEIAAFIGIVVVLWFILGFIWLVIQDVFERIAEAYCRHCNDLYLKQASTIRDMTYEIETMKDVHSSEMDEMRRYADEANVLMDRAVKHYCPNGIPLSSGSSGKVFDAVMHDIWAFRAKAMEGEKPKDAKPSDGVK